MSSGEQSENSCANGFSFVGFEGCHARPKKSFNLATYRLPRFSSPATLHSIDPKRLRDFLSPFGTYLCSRGIHLDDAQPIDHDALVLVFMSPDSSTPAGLINALFLVDEMATPEGMDSLTQNAALEKMAVQLDDQTTPADFAVMIWLQEPSIVERAHAEHFLRRPRTFAYFCADARQTERLTAPDTQTTHRLEAMLGGVFEEHNRSAACRVFVFDEEDEINFMVRHGEPFKREEALQSGTEPAGISYRPLKYDVLVYNHDRGELRVNSTSNWEQRTYLHAFGEVLFGNAGYFPPAAKYSLTPLSSAGEDSIACNDVEGMEYVRLREIQLDLGGPHREVVVHRATDLFASFKSKGHAIPSGQRLVKATFQIKFDDATRPRAVTITPPNVAQYRRDDDATRIESFFAHRGFIVAEPQSTVEADDPLLASSRSDGRARGGAG